MPRFILKITLGISIAAAGAVNAAFACDTVIDAADPFNPNTYSSCATTSANLSGLWMVVADYSIETGFWGVTWSEARQHRTTIQLRDNLDGTVSIADCNGDGQAREITLPVQNQSLTIENDDLVAFSFQVNSNDYLSGSVVSNSNNWLTADINSHSLVAIKLRDLSGSARSLGALSGEYGRSGKKKSLNNWQALCFDNKVIARGYSTINSSESSQVVETADIYAVQSLADGVEGDKLAILSIETPLSSYAGLLEAELNVGENTSIVGTGQDVNLNYLLNTSASLSGTVNIQDEDRNQVSANLDFNVDL